jgi:hypothetical protein
MQRARSCAWHARAQIQDIAARGKLPVLVGGSFYYLEGLLWTNFLSSDICTGGDAPSDIKKATESPGAAYARLQRVDPAMAERLHPNNFRKVLRSLEGARCVRRARRSKRHANSCLAPTVFDATGKPHSQWIAETGGQGVRSPVYNRRGRRKRAHSCRPATSSPVHPTPSVCSSGWSAHQTSCRGGWRRAWTR